MEITLGGMRNIIYVVGLAYLAYKFVQGNIFKAKGIENWDYKIRGVRVTSVSNKKITGVIQWDFKNTSNLSVQVRNVDLKMSYKGITLGGAYYAGPTTIAPMTDTSLDTAFNVDLTALGSTALDMVSDLAARYDVPVTLFGTMSVSQSNLPWIAVPFSINTTAKTIYSFYL
jgi:LEA14-like dessication related protein